MIDGCSRLDVKHLIILRRMQFYRRIFYMNDSCVLHNLFCALMSSDCIYDNYMTTVFTRDVASNIYMQFRANLQ